MFVERIVESEKNDIREPSLVVFMGVGGKDPFNIGDPLVAQVGEDGSAAVQKIGPPVDGHHVATALSHQGEGARVSDYLEDNVRIHDIRICSFDRPKLTEPLHCR